MRSLSSPRSTFRSLSPLAIGFLASLVISSPATAQRHGPRSAARAQMHPGPEVQPLQTPAETVLADSTLVDDLAMDDTVAYAEEEVVEDTVDAPACDGPTCDEGYDDYDDYSSVNVVRALFPYDDGTTTGPPILTLIVRNSGSARSRGSVVAVAPRNHLSMVSRMVVPSLAPGEMSVVQVPLEMGPDGAPCIAITITPSLVPSINESLRFASAAGVIPPLRRIGR